MDSKWVWAALVIIILALGGWYLSSGSSEMADTEEATEVVPDETASQSATAPATVTVTYTDEGFTPASVTIAAGDTVTWVNQSSKKMWVASAVHPSHTVYDNTSKDAHCAEGYTGEIPFDECAAVEAGTSYSFTFTKAGDWKYHNHVGAADTGEVVVTAAPAMEDSMSADATSTDAK